MSQSNQNLTGLVLAGRLVGKQTTQRQGNDGNPWIQHFIGVERPLENGFPGEVVVDRIQVPEKLMNAEFHTALEKLTGKSVFVKCYIRAFSTRAGAGYQLVLDGFDQAIIAQPAQSVRAA